MTRAGKMIGTALAVLTLTGMIGGGAVTAYKVTDNVKALNAAVITVDSKANYALEQLLNSLIAKLNKLRGKPNKTPYDLQQIRDWEKELKRLRALRYGAV